MEIRNHKSLPPTCAMRMATGAALLMAMGTASPVGAQPPSPASGPGASAAPSAAQTDQNSYLFGLTFGEQMHRVGITNQIVMDALTRGLKDGLQGKHSTPADQRQIQAFVQSIMQAAIAQNQSAAKDFLARNSHEKGVVTTASGLQYKVLIAGDHKAPAVTPTDEVTVNYVGRLLDGTEFDSTYARHLPASFSVNGVIPGWQEALVLMKPGAKWQLFVPPELAYGTVPKPNIPGGSLLLFEVELLSAKSTTPPAMPGAAAPGAVVPDHLGDGKPKSK